MMIWQSNKIHHHTSRRPIMTKTLCAVRRRCWWWKKGKEGRSWKLLCLHEWTGKRWKTLICGCNHIFCFDCIEHREHRENTCPLCKTQFSRLKQAMRRKGFENPNCMTKQDQQSKNLIAGAAPKGLIASSTRGGAGGNTWCNLGHFLVAWVGGPSEMIFLLLLSAARQVKAAMEALSFLQRSGPGSPQAPIQQDLMNADLESENDLLGDSDGTSEDEKSFWGACFFSVGVNGEVFVTASLPVFMDNRVHREIKQIIVCLSMNLLVRWDQQKPRSIKSGGRDHREPTRIAFYQGR